MASLSRSPACRAEGSKGIIRCMRKTKYWTGAHAKHKLRYHIVWIPKYRKRVLLGKLASRLKILLKQAAEVNKWKIEELSVVRDHIYMLVQTGPEIPVSKVVQILKGGTSRILRQEFPELEEFLWGDSLWADGYFAESVGVSDEQMVRRYIKDQHGQQ